MPSFDDLRRMIAGHHPVTRDDPRSVTVVVSASAGAPAQRVTLELLSGGGPARVALVAEVCPARFIEAQVALRYNATAEHGALALRRGSCALRQLFALDAIVAEDLVTAIGALATEATRLRRLYTRPSLPTTVYRATFAHFVD